MGKGMKRWYRRFKFFGEITSLVVPKVGPGSVNSILIQKERKKKKEGFFFFQNLRLIIITPIKIF